MGAACDEKMVEPIYDASSVQIMVVHHLIQSPHRPFENAGVLFALLFPFPIVNTTTECFLENQLDLPSAAVGHQELDVFSVVQQRTLSEKLEGEDGFSEVSVGHVSDVAQDSNRWVQRFQLADGFQALLNHEPRKGGHANVLCSASQSLNDSRRSVGGENKAGAATALLHHPTQVRLASVAQVIRVLNDDDA